MKDTGHGLKMTLTSTLTVHPVDQRRRAEVQRLLQLEGQAGPRV
jgi:hypothetical protein